MGLRKLSRSGCTQLFRNWVILLGRKGCRQFKEAILSQTRVINFVQKDTAEMFPKWEFDVEDTLAENIIKLMFPAVVSPAKKKVVKEDSPRPRKKARKEAPAEAKDIKTMFKDIADAMRKGFGTCLKEIKYLSERVEAVEKKVGITTKRKGTSSQNTISPPKPTLEPGSESVNGTNAGRKSLAEDKDVPADVPADASSLEDKAPEPSLVLLDKNQSTVSDLQKEDARYLEKMDAALALCRAKSDRTRKLAASQKKLYPGYNPFAPIDKTKLKELADWLKYFIIEQLSIKNPVKVQLEWLEDCVIVSRLHIDAWINVLRKRRLSVNFANSHWIAMWISIPKRHIVVFDSICSSISPEELDVVMEPFLYMVPYLLVEYASLDEVRAQYSLEPFTYERPTNIPPARAGDCGVYTLNKKDFAKPNGKSMRDKMAVDIFQELLDVHEFENNDMDDILEEKTLDD
ncbi:unnamed protein product [Brassica napus]|uniref:(rape) hypothetical protein n=1 Tax=Brassica napus TaxID=3708 RepID=A0A816JJG6_BRANA|nr:unnamed protein product [Brassica napus]